LWESNCIDIVSTFDALNIAVNILNNHGAVTNVAECGSQFLTDNEAILLEALLIKEEKNCNLEGLSKFSEINRSIVGESKVGRIVRTANAENGRRNVSNMNSTVLNIARSTS